MKVSVIIPVYNSEQHLRQCLDSVASQTLKDIEIICVDDGSTDSSYGILQQYAQADERFLVVRQENSYPGTARNRALTRARGDYVIFWDSDDFFEPAALEKMYDRAIEFQADICVCGINKYYQDSGELLAAPGNLRMALTGGQEVFNRLSNERYILNFTVTIGINKLISRQFILDHGLRFGEEQFGEDVTFYCAALCLAERITCINEYLVNYRTSQHTSLSDNVRFYPEASARAWRQCALYLKRQGVFPEQSFENRLVVALLHDLRNMKSRDAFIQAHQYLRENCLEDLELKERPAGYYDNENIALMARHLINDDPEQFYDALFYYHYVQATVLRDRLRAVNRRQSEQIASLSDQLAQSLKRNEEQLQLNRKLRRVLKRERRNLENSETRLAQLQNRQRKTAGKLRSAQKELEKLHSSLSYRLGRLITWLPRKIRALFASKAD